MSEIDEQADAALRHILCYQDAGLAAEIARCVEAVTRFEEQMAQVRTVSGATEDELAAADAEAGRWPVG